MCTTRRTWNPFISVSTMKQVMPPRPFSASVRANTRPKWALSAPEMNTLEPLMIQSPPSFTARAVAAGVAAAEGSVRPKKPRSRRQQCGCRYAAFGSSVAS